MRLTTGDSAGLGSGALAAAAGACFFAVCAGKDVVGCFWAGVLATLGEAAGAAGAA